MPANGMAEARLMASYDLGGRYEVNQHERVRR
jgi:hypothetical protein